MNYVDFSIAVSLFLFFFVIVLIFITNYFGGFAGLTKTSEYKIMAEDFYKHFFTGEGKPTNWEEDTSKTPVQIGLSDNLYVVPILVQETAGESRTNEPVMIYFDFDTNHAWNNTLRLYDNDGNEQDNILTEYSFSSTQYLSNTNLTFLINISANQKKKYFLYYSADEDVTAPNYSITYDTTSWIPNDGDSYTESTTSWSAFAGSGTPAADPDSIRGNYSINITGTFDSTGLGLEYNPASNITGVSNDWYVYARLYIDNKTDIGNIYMLLNDGSETITADCTSDMASGQWATFQKQISSSFNVSSFDATNGIDYIAFYATNNTAGITRTLKIDALKFQKKPLVVKKYPEKTITSLASDKIDALRNLSYDQLRKIFGEGYKFRIEISES